MSAIKKVSTLLSRRTSKLAGSNTDVNSAALDTPEGLIARNIRLFCESGGPNNAGEEVLHLPGIVDAAESSPGAAKEGADVVRKFLSKDNLRRPYVQYNAVMLMRILTDHPGATFTRNFDSKFVATVKDLLKEGRDMSVQQILRETLDNYQLSKSEDDTLKPLIAMWSEYKAKMAKKAGYNPAVGSAQPGSAMPGYFNQGAPPPVNHRSRHSRGLPAPHELASRIEESRTSAKLLTQMVQSTPVSEVLGNELLKEFADRCQSASRSIQAYISAENPAPDADTSLTLIETNDQLSMALSKHQRAVLNARKAAGQAVSPPPVDTPPADGGVMGATIERQPTAHSLSASGAPQLSVPAAAADAADNPFDDRNRAPSQERGREPAAQNGTARRADDDDGDESPQEPRRYGF